MNPILKLTIILWVLYFVGIAVRVLGRAGFAIRNPINPIGSRWQFVKKNYDTILVRTLITSCGFHYWLGHPTAVSDMLAFIHSPLSFNIPVTGGTAPMIGYLSDQLLDSGVARIAHIPQLAWLTWLLRGQIPSFPSITPTEKE